MAGDFKIKASPTQLFLDTSPLIPNAELVNVHPLITLVFKRDVNKSSRGSSSWKDKSLLTKLTKVDFKPGYSVSRKGLQNTIHQDTFSTKNSKFYEAEQEASCSCGFGIKRDVEERDNNENSTWSRRVFEHLIPCGEKRRRLSPCDKSKKVDPVRSFSPFENGTRFLVKAHNTGGRLDVQTGPERCIIQCPIRSKLEKNCKVSVEKYSLRVHVPVFWTRPSTKGVYKVIENSNLSPEKDQYQSDNIFRRYVNFSHTIREAHISRDTVIYLLQSLGFIINIKKSILHLCHNIEFLEMEIDSIKMTLSLTPEKVQKVVKTCQNNLRSHSTTLLELTRVIGLPSSTIQAVEPAKIQLRFL